MSEATPITAAGVTRQFVLAKCRYFLDVHLWPLRLRMDPEKWLDNFEADELPYAVHLLNAFTYYSDPLIDHLFISAFNALSTEIAVNEGTLSGARRGWKDFMNKLIITPVEGERPSVTDSGNLFARKARQLLQIEESRILSAQATLDRVIRMPSSSIVFVDDFVGSGRQFVETWIRLVPVGASSISFAHLALGGQASFYYCPLVCTEKGYTKIRTSCPTVKLSPAHLLPERYSALSNESVVWPSSIRSHGIAFIESASKRAGIPDVDGGVDDWRGFRKLGLSLAFEHSVPDATLPIFYWDKNGWNPLIRRH